MQMDINSSSTDIDRQCSDPDEYIDQSIESISRGFNRKLQLECDDDSMTKLLPDADVHENEEEIDDDDDGDDDEDGDDDDFTFVLVGEDESSTSDDKLLENGQIRPVFPLFDRNLLLDVEEIDRLPMKPPVDKVFIQSRGGFPSSTASERDENHDATIGPYCDWSKRSSTSTTTATATATVTAELRKKSNSTGFSKLWRLKEKINRSNSDGRDAFVFLRSSDRTTTASTATTTASSSPSSSSAVAGDGAFAKVNVAGGKSKVVKQATKAKRATVSAHEAYLKSRGGHTEEERRRSYLPYRPELMGFFTNVHGGLTKNVHPY